jgi:hypothetical protein
MPLAYGLLTNDQENSVNGGNGEVKVSFFDLKILTTTYHLRFIIPHGRTT